MTAGMHGDWRTVDAASSFYESSVPSAVRNLGNDAVVAFLDGKHASHIEAVVNAPGRMMDAANIVWEAARDNLARGGADMTPTRTGEGQRPQRDPSHRDRRGGGTADGCCGRVHRNGARGRGQREREPHLRLQRTR